MLIDDFKTGELSLSETSVVDNVNKSVRFQSGTSILGGVRRVIYYNSSNPYGQKVSVTILTKPGIFVVSSGYKASNGIELFYGLDTKGNSKPLNLDLTKYKRMNIEFDGANKPLNLSVVVYGQQGRNSYAENLTAVDIPYTLTIPLESLINGGVDSFTPKNVKGVHIGIQPLGVAYAESFGIKRIWFD
ncbi:MAG: hypothetical protein K9J37_14610 [Saprospiraceae bacterium]|nr:hypothetical protein [Saprospiraceae bacterium]MCF8251139.1 hypothetical protein [Saprospiraceae bacterium]MCF8282949.1 hypothetical protein [Bacteroidales bacterium]MCF8312903.1 hypothetical protein [Saprospiraceae bacterium]MCF8441398.1 hypothetical protein [Saprospiraceae bacterium]